MGNPEGGGSAASAPLYALVRAVGEKLQRIPRGGGVAIAIAWAALIWVVSSSPPPPLGARGPFGGFLSNLAHAPEFGLLALWLALAAPRRDGWPILRAPVAAAILAAVAAYAAVDEVHQSFTPHRDPSFFDALTDVTGAAATLACIAAAGGPRASSRALSRRFLIGIAACALSAALGVWLPDG